MTSFITAITMANFVTRTTNVVVVGAIMITNITNDFLVTISPFGTKVIHVHMATYATIVTRVKNGRWFLWLRKCVGNLFSADISYVV
jgi:hypothetical protein